MFPKKHMPPAEAGEKAWHTDIRYNAFIYAILSYQFVYAGDQRPRYMKKMYICVLVILFRFFCQYGKV